MPPRDHPAIDRSASESTFETARPKSRRGAGVRKVAPILSLCIFGVAVFVLSRQLAELDAAAVLSQLRGTTPGAMAFALLLTAASFLILSGYDSLALRQIGVRLPYRIVLSTSFQSYAFTNTIGFALITGGSVRFRHYTEAGLKAMQVASVQILCVLTYVIGAAAVVGTALLLDPPNVLGVATPVAALMGLGLLATVAAYIGACAVFRGPVRLGRWSGRLPPPSVGLRQIALVALDLTVAGMIPYVLLSGAVDISPLEFLGAYVVAITVGVVSNVPGGLGVFESAMVLLLPSIPDSSLLAALLAFRVVYFLLPAGIAALLLIGQEWARQRGR